VNGPSSPSTPTETITRNPQYSLGNRPKPRRGLEVDDVSETGQVMTAYSTDSDGQPTCGHPTTTTGDPCQRPVSAPDDRCYLHADDGCVPEDHGAPEGNIHAVGNDGGVPICSMRVVENGLNMGAMSAAGASSNSGISKSICLRIITWDTTGKPRTNHRRRWHRRRR
jgi:hypothetical protein